MHSPIACQRDAQLRAQYSHQRQVVRGPVQSTACCGMLCMSYTLDALYSMQQEQQRKPGDPRHICVDTHMCVLLLYLAAVDLSCT